MITRECGGQRLSSWFGSTLIVLAGLAALHSVVHHGFLNVGFDDPGFVTEVEAVGPWSWQRLWMCFDRFYLYDYVPLPMVSFLLDYQAWGLDPRGYHSTNLLLHLAAALLVQRWATVTLQSAVGGVFAGLVFAIHPVQVEAVAIVAQRKTLLSAVFLLLALLAYRRYVGTKLAVWNALGVAAFAAACLSKSSVVVFPLLLLLYDWLERRQFEWRDKIAYGVVALAAAAVSVYAKLGTVVKAPHGESVWMSALVMSRVWWEYLAALFAPTDLAPAYYYRRSEIAGAMSYVALAALLAFFAIAWLYRERARWTAFCVGWMVVALLPVANIVPIAVVRADRYLYLPMIGFCLWIGSWMVARERAHAKAGRNLLIAAMGMWCAWLAGEGARYAEVFRDDVSARARAVERHPWAAPAHYLLALAWLDRGDVSRAETLARMAVDRDPTFTRAANLLSELEARKGARVPSSGGTSEQ
ncbi:MAG: membrane protein [Candidatus Binatia bacterium]|nr:MAG: membrane protein [Candidatus Binatia bacterium]